MSDDLEKNISHQLEGFQLQPGPQVWERIAAALPEKRRRRFAIWWLLPLAACLGGGIWLITGVKKGTHNSSKIVLQQPSFDSTTNRRLMPDIIPGDTSIAHSGDQLSKGKAWVTSKKLPPDKEQAKPTEHKTIAGKQATAKQKPSETGSINNTNENKITETGVALRRQHLYSAIPEKEDMDDIITNTTREVIVSKKIIQESALLNTGLLLPEMDSTAVSLPEVVAKKNTLLTKTTDTLPQPGVGIKTTKAKNKNIKPEWSLMFGIGKSNLSNSSTNSNKSLFDIASLSNPIGQNTNTAGTFSNPTGCISAGAGLMRIQQLSRHVSWQAGISYQYLSSKQRVGSRNDSLLLFTAFANAAFNRAGSTNDAGTVQLNQVHRLQIAPGLSYMPNPEARLPLRFFADISVAYNMGNHILLHDYRSGSYIRSAQLSNKIMIGGEAGMDLLISHNIQAGLFYQHDFTNVAKAKAGSAFRWNQLQLRIGIALSRHGK